MVLWLLIFLNCYSKRKEELSKNGEIRGKGDFHKIGLVKNPKVMILEAGKFHHISTTHYYIFKKKKLINLRLIREC